MSKAVNYSEIGRRLGLSREAVRRAVDRGKPNHPAVQMAQRAKGQEQIRQAAIIGRAALMQLTDEQIIVLVSTIL